MLRLEKTRRLATTFLVFMGVVALIALSISSHTYFAGMKSVRGYSLSLETVDLQEDEVKVAVRLENETAENMRITSVEYSLYLDEQFVVTNQNRHQEYLVPGDDSMLLEERLTPGQWQMDELEDALQSGGENSWEVRGRYRVIIPGSDRGMYINWEDSIS